MLYNCILVEYERCGQHVGCWFEQECGLARCCSQSRLLQEVLEAIKLIIITVEETLGTSESGGRGESHSKGAWGLG